MPSSVCMKALAVLLSSAVSAGTLASGDPGNATRAAINAAASARPGPPASTGAAAACAKRLPLGEWKPCAAGNQCYRGKMECDGGDPDCADGTDESPRVCGAAITAVSKPAMYLTTALGSFLAPLPSPPPPARTEDPHWDVHAAEQRN